MIAKNFAILGCFQYHTGATGTVIFTMILWLCLSPFGCLQYHTGTTGTVIMKFQRRMVVIMMLFVHVCRSFDTGRNYSKVRSFNFLSSSYDHLQSQDYTVSSSFSLLPYFPYFQTIFSYFDRPACMYTNTYLYQYQYLRNAMIIPILFCGCHTFSKVWLT